MKKFTKLTIQNAGNIYHFKRFLFSSARSVLFACAFILIAATMASAANYTVTNTADSGAGSLRDIIIMANNTIDDDTINFSIPSSDAGCTGGVCTITLTTGDLRITNPTTGGALTITGTGARTLKISGNNNSRIFRILDDNGSPGSVPVTITDLTVTNGKTLLVLGSNDSTVGAGGGIHNLAVLILTNVAVTNNFADSGTSGVNSTGGGIYSFGNLTLNNCIVNNNTTSKFSNNFTTYFPGSVSASSLVLNNSTVSNNLGGGLSVNTNLTMNNSIVSGNSVNNGGNGGISYGSAIITNSTISGNTSSTTTGALQATVSGGSLTMNNSTISGNTGYAVQLSSSNSNSSITNTTISGNTGRDIGAIVVFRGILNLTNVTITNNRATTPPASTLNGGATGGIKLGGSNTLSLLFVRNSIIAGNFSTANFGNPPSATNTPDIYLIKNSSGDPADPSSYGVFTSKGNNLIGDATHISEPGNTGASINGQSSDILNQSPLLEPLGNYGGATRTHALSSSSPAINAGNDCVLMINGCGTNDPAIALAADQRGAARVGTVDIGAFELNDNPTTGYRADLPATSTSQTYNVIIAQYDDTQYPNLTYSITNGRLPNGVNLTQTSSLANQLTGDKSSGASQDKPDAPTAIKTVALTGMPTEGGTFNFTITSTDGTNTNNTNYSLSVASPTAASVNVGGRAMTASGRGIAGVRITMTGANGEVRTATTSAFGYYRFTEVAAGATYIFSASGKRYRFAQQSQVLNVIEDMNEVNFIGSSYLSGQIIER
ncbi:MAG: choice-of-anchor Q domain-containing protein [Pyrinomonadaceae bacterium]